MATFTRFYSFTEALAEKVHNLGSDVLKVALTNTAPSLTDTVFAPGTLHPPPAAATGYAPTQATISSSAQASGIYKLVLADVLFTAGAGGLGPFRYAILYNDTAASDELIGWYDYAAAITLLVGETFTVDFDPTAGAITLGA